MQNSQIKNSLRSVISLVDKLRDIKLQSYIQLPKIVAVGGQSSGKSSLIEQIVGLDFLPRGSGVVTRRPLEIRMTYQENLTQSYAYFEQLANEKFTDFQKVKKTIQHLTDKVCGTNMNIVDKAIVLNVYSSNCPNLTVIDLPGLTRISLGNQVQNIHQVTKNMIKKYISDENTIILCVIPANQDITNDEVLHMARQIDKKGERTIGCITKIDIMDRGTDARSLLLNKGEVPLKLGYVGIKNRSQQDINENKKVKQSLEEEKMYFSKSPIYSSLPLSCLGTSSLVEKLTKVLENLIINYLPVLLQKIKEKKQKLHEKIQQYGRPLPKTKQQQNLLIWQLCNTYLTNFKSSIQGIPSRLQCSERLQKISTHINHQLSQFLQLQSAHDFKQYLKDQKINFALRKFDTINQLGFPSMNSFLFLINPLLNDLKRPMESSLTHLCDHMNHMSEIISDEVVCQYVKFKEYLNGRTQEIIAGYKKKCAGFLESLLDCEIKGIEYQKLDFDRSKTQTKKYTELQLKNPLIPILRQSVINYYNNCVKNLRELVPKNFKYLILNQSIKKIEFQIFQSCLNSEDKIQIWLQINNSSKQQRLNNQKEYDVIQKAEQFILTYAGFSRGSASRRNKKREEREKEMEDVMVKRKEKEKGKVNDEKWVEKTPKKQQQPNKDHKMNFMQFDFTKKNESKEPRPQIKQPHQQKEQKQISKEKVFTQLFGTGQIKQIKKQEPPNQPNASHRKPIFTEKIKEDETIKQKYNQEMGKATDKAVDEVFKNQKFQQESKKAVQKGTSAAIQKQLGVSEKTGNLFGQGAGWLWGQQKTQNLVKDQAKKAARDKTQM